MPAPMVSFYSDDVLRTDPPQKRTLFDKIKVRRRKHESTTCPDLAEWRKFKFPLCRPSGKSAIALILKEKMTRVCQDQFQKSSRSKRLQGHVWKSPYFLEYATKRIVVARLMALYNSQSNLFASFM